MNDEPISITIKVADYTSTELMTEIQRMSFRDPRINELLVVAFRKMADAIENKQIGITNIKTAVDHSAHNIPDCTVSLTFIDVEQEHKSNPATKE